METAFNLFMSRARSYIHTSFHLDRASIFSGIRITLITVLPIIVGFFFVKRPDLGMMGFLSALYAVLADVGGAYRTRAFSMGVGTLGIALAAFVSTLVAGSVWLAVSLMFLCAFGCGMLGIYGNIGSKVGFVITGIFILILGQPANMTIAVERWLSFIAGGAWAMLLTLWLWPWRPYQPVRDALATYYCALGNLVSRVCRAHGAESATSWHETLQVERAQVLAAHDSAHSLLISFRSARNETSTPGQRFLLLTLSADRIFDVAIALAENSEIALTHTQDVAIKTLLEESVQQVTTMLTRLARRIKDDEAIDAGLLSQNIQRLATLESDMRAALPRLLPDYAALASVRNVIRLQKQVIQEMETAFRHAQSLHTGRDATSRLQSRSSARFDWMPVLQRQASLLLDNLTPRSLIFRHSLRIAVSTALVVAFFMLLRIPNGYWIPLTILFILKPDYGGTRQRANQRVLGTILGGVISALLVATIHNEILIIVLLVALGFFTFAHLSGNYGIFVTFLTLFVLILLDINAPGHWVLAMFRMGNTVLGGVIAVLFGYLFFPLWEQERLPSQLARTITANRTYFHVVMSAYLNNNSVDMEIIHRASRRAHLENSNAAASYQRLLSEPKTKQGDAERFYALVTYNQHFCDRITALAMHVHAFSKRYHALPDLKPFVEQTEGVLRDLEEAITSGSRLCEVAALDESLNHVQSTLKSMIDESLLELAAQKSADTSKQSVVHDVSYMRLQLDRLASDINGMAQLQA